METLTLILIASGAVLVLGLLFGITKVGMNRVGRSARVTDVLEPENLPPAIRSRFASVFTAVEPEGRSYREMATSRRGQLKRQSGRREFK